MHRTLAIRLAAAILAFAACALAPVGARAISLPPDFVAETATPGHAFELPTAIAFLPGGRLLVAEKNGRVWTVTNGIVHDTPLLDLNAEVLSNEDRGLLGLGVDPAYATNRRIYLYYSVDPDSDGVDDEDDAFNRVVRFEVSAEDTEAVDPASRTVLVGATWRTGVPDGAAAHNGGALRWGRDGSLLVSTGDGAHFDAPDGGGSDPDLFGPDRTDPYENVGAFRAQMITSLGGKILRVNPEDGSGYASNPYFDGDPFSNRSRVWAYGLRNPFRFAVRPGTGSPDTTAGAPGTLIVGDVGWQLWEEFDVAATGGLNFGWPCYEGPATNIGYFGRNEPHHGCGSIGTPENPAQATGPLLWWHHGVASQSHPPGTVGNSATAGAFYTAQRYPAAYWGAYFFGDFGQGWIRAAVLDASNQLVSLSLFATGADAPVDFAVHPAFGDLYYVSILSGEVRRIRYTGPQPNRSPVAVAGAAPRAGARPFEVAFTSEGSSDVDEDPLAFAWNFGDGESEAGPSPAHTYRFPGTYDAILTATDGQGGDGRDTVRVIVTASAAFPTTPVLDAFDRGDAPLDAPWTGDFSGLAVADSALARSCCEPRALWGAAAFGPNQEAFVTVTADDSASCDLLLKAQGDGPNAARARVRWDPAAGEVSVATFHPAQGWVARGAPIDTVLAPGTRLGARAYANGVLGVYADSTGLALVELGDWPAAGAGGSIGVAFSGPGAALVDDFGGGDAILDPNPPPVVTIDTPANGAFYVAGDTLHLACTASDDPDPVDSLTFRWTVDLHHNNHVHPSTLTFTTPSAEFEAASHDDGSGVFLRLRLAVTDLGRRTTTSSVDVFPEVDVSPDSLELTPDTLGTEGPAEARFLLRNTGRMLAPRARWRLVADTLTIAQGDTSIGALDSVGVRLRLKPKLIAGTHVLRLVADTLGAVNETNEANNAVTQDLVVVEGPVADELPPLFTFDPVATPAAVEAWLRWKTDEPTTALVRFGTDPSLPDSAEDASLELDHSFPIGPLPLGTKIYVQVAARDTAGHWALAALDSFVTQESTADAPAAAPAAIRLSAARPNPGRGAVGFTLELPRRARVELVIVDVAGRVVGRDDRVREAGRGSLEWRADGAGVPPGLYLAQVRVGGETFVRRFVLLR